MMLMSSVGRSVGLVFAIWALIVAYQGDVGLAGALLLSGIYLTVLDVAVSVDALRNERSWP